MRILSKSEALNYLRRQKAPIEVRRAFGDYQEDENVGLRTNDVYDEERVFYAAGGNQGGVQLVAPTIYQNNTSFSTYPFVIGTTQGSTQIVPQNLKRMWLLIQNQSTASDMYVNFSSGAGVGNGIKLSFGVGIVIDVNVPNNSINVFFNNATPQAGVIVEGAPTS